MMLKGGFTNYEQSVGVLMLDTKFPRPQGDIGNALTFDFPVCHKTVYGANTAKIMGDSPSSDLLELFIHGARELEREGGLPVFDVNTLINWTHGALWPRPFLK